MVTWVGDGNLSGYNGTTRKLEPNTYKFATAGTVDLVAANSGKTRLHFALPAAYGATNYPNRLSASAAFNVTAADFSNNPGSVISAAMFIVNDLHWGGSAPPTPLQLLGLGDSVVSVYRATHYLPSANSNYTFVIPGPGPGELDPNTKYWVLVMPTALKNPNSNWAIPNDLPVKGATINTIGRALSIVTNRQPAAPVITSPSSGVVVAPGASFQITYDPNDPDAQLPSDAPRTNEDLAGVHFQYARVPSPGYADPVWLDLPYYDAQNKQTIAGVIRNQNDLTANDGRINLINNLGFQVLCGTNTPTPNKALLPTGEWQIRCRTYDFGHPYPVHANPLGVTDGSYRVNRYMPNNVSAWSTPVRVSIPAQVPPAVPISPTRDLAIQEGSTVRLAWQYRNTFRPPYAQANRRVQIRKVGTPVWYNVAAGPSAVPYIDLLPSVPASGTARSQVIANPGFETNNLDGWTYRFGGSGMAVTNVSNPANAHSGSRFLETTATTSGDVMKAVTLNPAYDTFQFQAWYQPRLTYSQVTAYITFLDSGGVPLAAFPSPVVTRPVAGAASGLWPEYVYLDTGEVVKPAGAVTAWLIVQPGGRDVTAANYSGERLDDVAFICSSSTATDAFTMEATTNYEWRVQTGDTTGLLSNFSEPSSFWIVDVPGSGQVAPVPSDTIQGATLGCGVNRAFIYRRGGRVEVGEVTNPSYVDWDRLRDEMSTARVDVSDWDIDCGNMLADLQTWAYELVIFRDNGYSMDRVWEGPITLLTYEVDKVTIHAKDMMAYPYRRIIRQAMNDNASGDTVTSRALRVLQNVMAPDDPNVLAYVQMLSRDDDPKQYRVLPPYSKTGYEEIDDMAANAGLDYTVVGRAILLWSTKHRIGTLPEFRDADLGAAPIVSEYGMSFADRYAISDGNGIYGVADRTAVSGNLEKYGLVEMLSSTWASDAEGDADTYTQEGVAKIQASFEDSAERSIADRCPPPVVVRVPDNTTLNPSTVVSIQQLVPGVIIPLRSNGTLREVASNQKLDAVKVVQQGGKETISITLSPFGRDDTVPVEEE